MNISIQQYRASIGLFVPCRTISRKICKKPANLKPTKFQNVLRNHIVLILTSIVLFLSSYQYPSKASSTQTPQDLWPSPSKHSSNSSSVLKNDRSQSRSYRRESNVQNFIHPCRVSKAIFDASEEDSQLFYIFTKISNFVARYVNGNGSSKGIKIAHWNKGSSHLVNKISEIKNIIAKYRPHILGVSEANLLENHDQSLVAVSNCI